MDWVGEPRIISESCNDVRHYNFSSCICYKVYTISASFYTDIVHLILLGGRLFPNENTELLEQSIKVDTQVSPKSPGVSVMVWQ